MHVSSITLPDSQHDIGNLEFRACNLMRHIVSLSNHFSHDMISVCGEMLHQDHILVECGLLENFQGSIPPAI